MNGTEHQQKLANDIVSIHNQVIERELVKLNLKNEKRPSQSIERKINKLKSILTIDWSNADAEKIIDMSVLMGRMVEQPSYKTSTLEMTDKFKISGFGNVLFVVFKMSDSDMQDYC